MFIGQGLWYPDLIIFIWEKTSSQRWVYPKNAVKRRGTDHTEAAHIFWYRPKSDSDRLFGFCFKLWARRPRNRGSIDGRCKRFLSNSVRPDELCGSPSLNAHEGEGSFRGVKVAGMWSWPFTSIYTALSVQCTTLVLLHTRAPAVSFYCRNESGGRNFETCDLIS